MDRSLLAFLGGALLAAAAVTLAYHGPATSEPEPVRLVAIFKTSSASNDFWASLREGIESGAEDFQFEVSVRAPREESHVDEQVEILRQAIEEAPGAIVLAAADVERLVEPVREARRRGIRVVLVDSFIATADAEAEVGTDNVEAGRRCGEALLRALPAGGRVAVMSYVKGSSTAIGRERGLLAALGEALGEARGGAVEILGTSYSGSEAGLAYEQARAILAAVPRPAGIAALNLPTATGAARALAESGLQEEVALVAFDNSAEMVKFIERGVIRASIVQKPFNMGYLAVKAARDLLEGRSSPGFINTGSVAVDRENMFEPANQKLLFPVAPVE